MFVHIPPNDLFFKHLFMLESVCVCVCEREIECYLMCGFKGIFQVQYNSAQLTMFVA